LGLKIGSSGLVIWALIGVSLPHWFLSSVVSSAGLTLGLLAVAGYHLFGFLFILGSQVALDQGHSPVQLSYLPPVSLAFCRRCAAFDLISFVPRASLSF
jgi:hypothetical protein